MVLPTEGFIANITSVRPFVGVRPLVNEKVVRLGETTLTETTDELFLWATGDAIDAS